MSLLLLFDTADTSGGIAIVNNANTAVDYLGNGTYRITKTAGAEAWDASAVSAAAIPGDLVLRIRAGQSDLDFFLGVNSDPLTDNSYASLDRGIHFVRTTALSMYENGTILLTPAVYSTSDYVFIKRVGSAITVHKGLTTDIDDASLIYTFTSLAGDLYFDSSFSSVGAIAEVSFFAPHDLAGSSSLTFTTSGALAAAGLLSGATSLTHTTAGNLAGSGALAGSSALAFSPTGAISGQTALTGASALTFSPAGALTGSGVLSGATSAAFTAAGNLTDAGGGLGPISGSASLSWSASASISFRERWTQIPAASGGWAPSSPPTDAWAAQRSTGTWVQVAPASESWADEELAVGAWN
jgi:hypothetical protein